MFKLKSNTKDLVKRIEELEEKVRTGERTNRALKDLQKQYADVLKNLDKTTREIYAIRSIVNMPQLYLDDDLNIVGYSNEFFLLTGKAIEYSQKRTNIKHLLSKSDFNKFRAHVQRIKELENLPFDQGREWELRYKGPDSSDVIGANWTVYHRAEKSKAQGRCRWEIVNEKGKFKFIHRPHTLDTLDCCLMSVPEYGGADEDLKLVYKVRTSSRKEEILDLTAMISGTSGREGTIPDITGYTVCTGSNYNSLGRIQKQGADVISHPEALDTDTEYVITVERTGGRVSRSLDNLTTGQKLPVLEFIDYNAMYDQQNHLGFYTYSGALEIFDVEIYTRRSLFNIEQFRIPINFEVGLLDENLEGRVYNLKYAKTEILGKVLHTLMLEDITRRKKDEEALRESEKKYRGLFEESSVARSTTSFDGRFIDVNSAMLNLFGVTAHEIVTMNAREFYVNPEDRDKYMEVLEKQGYVKDYEAKFRKKDGTPLDCLINSSIHLDKDGKFYCIQGSISDITERKRMEARLKESQKMEVIGRLASGVAHEVRNPLNAILAITEALFQDLGDNPEYKPYLDHIRLQVDRLSTLMRDLLELGKPLQKNTFVPVSIYEVCAGAIELWHQSSTFHSRSVRLFTPGQHSNMKVIGDGLKLKQALINLLENAAQHSPEDREITVTLEEETSKVWIKVKDQGTGIKPEIMSEVFKPFFTTRPRGAGLGLSIVKSIVETHGGDIHIYNNNPPPGLTVELYLPRSGEKG